jgi:hypothetical protein
MRIVYLWRLCFTLGANRLALRVPSRDGMQKAALSARRPNQHALEVEREDPDLERRSGLPGVLQCGLFVASFEVAS